MNRKESLIIREIKNYINNKEINNKTKKNKEEIIKQIEDQISSNSEKDKKFNNILNLLKKLKSELQIKKQDSQIVINKKNELSDYIFNKKDHQNIDLEIELNINTYSKEKIIFLLKELKMIFSKKEQIFKSEIFSILKRNCLILKNCNIKKEILLQRIISIKKVFKLAISYNNKLLPFSKRRAFLKWKIKCNEFFVKFCVEKIAINARINNIVVLWRLKKITENKNFDKNLNFLKFVEKFCLVVQNAEFINNFDSKIKAFENIKIFGLKQKQLRILMTSKKVLLIFNDKMKLHSDNVFGKILLKNPKKLLLERLFGKVFKKKKNCFYKLFLLSEKKKIEKFFELNSLISSKLKIKAQETFSNLDNPYFFLEEILNKLRKNNFRNFFQNIKRKNFLHKIRKKKLENFVNLIKKKNYLNKKNSFENILDKKQNKKKINKFCDIFKKIKKRNSRNSKIGSFEEILVNSKNKKFNKINDLLEKLESNCLKKKKNIFQKLITPFLKKKRLMNYFVEKMIFSFYIKKYIIFEKLTNYNSENTVELKKKMLFNDLKRNIRTNKFYIFSKLKNLKNENDDKRKNIIKRIINVKKRQKYNIFHDLKNNKKKLKKKQKMDGILKLAKIFQKKIYSGNNLFMKNLKPFLKKEKEIKVKNLEIKQNNLFSIKKIKIEKNISIFESIIINKKDDKKKNNLLWYFQIIKISKILENNKKISKIKAFDVLQKNYKDFLLKKFALKIVKDVFNKKISKYNDCLKNDNINYSKNLFNFVDYINYLKNKKLKEGFKNFKKFNDREIKKYFVEKFSKKLLIKSKLKKLQVFLKLKNLVKDRNTKINGTNLLEEVLQKNINKKKSIFLKKLALKSKLRIKPKLENLLKILKKKKSEQIEENYYLIKSYKTPEFEKYKKNPKLLPKLKNILNNKIRKKKILLQFLKEPVYFKLKENAKLLKPYEKKHLENLNYLYKNSNLKDLKKIGTFNYSINIQIKDKNPLLSEIHVLKKKIINFLKEKAELVNKLEKKNINILEDTHKIYNQKQRLEKLNKKFEKDLENLYKDEIYKKNELNKLKNGNKNSELAENTIYKSLNEGEEKNFLENLKKEILDLKIKMKEVEDEKKGLDEELKNAEKSKGVVESEIEELNSLGDKLNEQKIDDGNQDFENLKKNSNDGEKYVKELIEKIENLKRNLNEINEKEINLEENLKKIELDPIHDLNNEENIKRKKLFKEKNLLLIQKSELQQKNKENEENLQNSISKETELKEKIQKLKLENDKLLKIENRNVKIFPKIKTSIKENTELHASQELLNNEEIILEKDLKKNPSGNLVNQLTEEELIVYNKNKNDIDNLEFELQNVEIKKNGLNSNTEKINEEILNCNEKIKNNIDSNEKIENNIDSNEEVEVKAGDNDNIKKNFQNLDELKLLLEESKKDKSNIIENIKNYEEELEDLKNVLGISNFKNIEENIKKLKKENPLIQKNNLEILEISEKKNLIPQKLNDLKNKEEDIKNLNKKISEIEQEKEKLKKLQNDKLQKVEELEKKIKAQNLNNLNPEEFSNNIDNKNTPFELLNENEGILSHINELEENLKKNKKKINDYENKINEKQKDIDINKEEIETNKDTIDETLYKFQNLSDNMKKEGDLFRDYSEIFKNDFQKIYKQKELILKNYKEINDINEKLNFLNKKKNLVNQEIQVEDTRKKLEPFLMSIIACNVQSKYLKSLDFFFSKIKYCFKKKINLGIQKFGILKNEKRMMINKGYQVNLNGEQVEKKYLLFFILMNIFNKNIFKYFKMILAKSEMNLCLKFMHKLTEWKFQKKNAESDRNFTVYIKKKEILLNLITLIEDKTIQNLTEGLKKIQLCSTMDRESQKKQKIKSVLNIHKSLTNRNLKYHFLKWHSLRYRNLWKDNFINKIIWKTKLFPQTAIWRLKYFPKKIPKLDPLKRLALIKIKKLFINTKFFSFSKLNNRLLTYRDDYKTKLNVPTERSGYDTVGFSDEEDDENLTRHYTIKNLNYGTYQTNEIKEESEERSISEGVEDSKLSEDWFNNNKMKPNNETSSFKNIHNFNESHRQMIYLILSHLKKKKSMIIHKLRYFNIKSAEFEKKNEIKEEAERKKKNKLDKLQVVINMLINENIMNKKEMDKRTLLIRDLKIEIKDKKVDLVFVKDHYNWVFLRRIKDIIDKNYMKEILFSFDKIRNYKD